MADGEKSSLSVKFEEKVIGRAKVELAKEDRIGQVRMFSLSLVYLAISVVATAVLTTIIPILGYFVAGPVVGVLYLVKIYPQIVFRLRDAGWVEELTSAEDLLRYGKISVALVLLIPPVVAVYSVLAALAPGRPFSGVEGLKRNIVTCIAIAGLCSTPYFLHKAEEEKYLAKISDPDSGDLYFKHATPQQISRYPNSEHLLERCLESRVECVADKPFSAAIIKHAEKYYGEVKSEISSLEKLRAQELSRLTPVRVYGAAEEIQLVSQFGSTKSWKAVIRDSRNPDQEYSVSWTEMPIRDYSDLAKTTMDISVSSKRSDPATAAVAAARAVAEYNQYLVSVVPRMEGDTKWYVLYRLDGDWGFCPTSDCLSGIEKEVRSAVSKIDEKIEAQTKKLELSEIIQARMKGVALADIQEGRVTPNVISDDAFFGTVGRLMASGGRAATWAELEKIPGMRNGLEDTYCLDGEERCVSAELAGLGTFDCAGADWGLRAVEDPKSPGKLLYVALAQPSGCYFEQIDSTEGMVDMFRAKGIDASLLCVAGDDFYESEIAMHLREGGREVLATVYSSETVKGVSQNWRLSWGNPSAAVCK